MRMDLRTVKTVAAEVDWESLDLKDKHTSEGTVTFKDTPGEFLIRLVRTRFGGVITIYAKGKFTVEELAQWEGSTPMPLPHALNRFVGGDFVLDGAPGGNLKKGWNAIELLTEVPEGYRGNASREVLTRNLTAEEARGIFTALGMDLTEHEFETFPGDTNG